MRQLAFSKIDIPTRGRPFLRWAGGKSRIAHHLKKLVPRSGFRQYWEPFLGAAALYFCISPRTAFLSDSNQDLIDCYQHVRANPDLIHRYLETHLSKTSEEYYYSIRDIYNSSGPSAAQAARFIYLNKSSFNGIFRVNTKGEFNVPFGHKLPPALPSLPELREASKALQTATLAVMSYEEILDHGVVAGDFVYLDPPYPPLNGTAYFTHYTRERFSWHDQERVAAIAQSLRERGCYVMVSNADLPKIRGLYGDWSFHPIPVVRWIAANGSRLCAAELVITSYETLPGEY